jgi:radical SAM superfamily enzyme YgiQ (UPF0313 family)
MPYRRLVVVLIRPSKYDDEGYVVRHWRGTLPSNTLSCLNSLTEDVARRGELGGVDVRVEVLDEIVTRVDPRRIARRFRRRGTKLVAGLVGVQTNQFPRAQDLARQFKAEGAEVIIGGFHVSGAVAMARSMPPECQAMIDAGVTLVLGEVEDRWGDILKDVLAGRLQPVYNLLRDLPDLSDQPLPRASAATQRKFVLTGSGTIDAGRGCPFFCSFCTIINVQGRKMRARGPAHILAQIRDNYTLKGRRGIRHYFFTDDNFSRNPHWEAVFDGLIRMREDESLAIDFMMQVDTQATKIPGFVEKAARAGCVQVFIGMETVRDDNLHDGGKPQNKSADYKEMIARWHEAGVVCHVGYIIGFPNDTYDRVMEDVRTLRETLLVDQASFFMMMPLPGSRDHADAVEEGVPLDGDYNRYDGTHATRPHPQMSPDEWLRAYRDAWTVFYSPEHMRQSLLRQNPHTYWAVLKNLIWYRAAMVEGAHPMMTGFFRLKDRTSRRATFPIESRYQFARRRAREIAHIVREYVKLYFEVQDLWLQTRIRRDEYRFLGDLRRLASQSMQDVKLNWARVHAGLSARAGVLQEALGDRWALGGTMAARLDAISQALGGRAAAIRESMAGHADAVRARVDASVAGARRGLTARARAWHAAVSDLHLPRLRPLRPPSWPARALRRLNLFSLDRIEHDPRLTAYWLRARRQLARFQLWRLNPVAFSWNLARGAQRAVVFFVAMIGERY